MFKKLSDMEKAMCTALNYIKTSDIESATSYPGSDTSIAMHQCLENGYVENLSEWKDANGNYHFDSLGHVHLNQKGLTFLRDMSFGFRIKNSVFDILKGTAGFLLGIASSLIIDAVIWIIKHSEEIQKFLHYVSEK